MKPRIPAQLAPLLVKIDGYIRQYNLRGQALASAASDVLDGLVLRHEIEPLIRRRLLAVIPYSDDAVGWWCRDDATMCGRRYTVHFTERAIRALWPDRAAGVRVDADPVRAALEKLLRAEEKYVRDTGLPQPDDLIQTAVNEARQLLGWPACDVKGGQGG